MRRIEKGLIVLATCLLFLLFLGAAADVPGDPGKNVKSDPVQFPSIEELKNRLVKQAVDELFDKMVYELNSSSEDYYTIAQRAEENEIAGDAIENYVRFIYFASSLRDQRVHEANEYIYEQLGLKVLRRKR